MKRLVKTPKLHLGDTGLACTLLGQNTESLYQDRTSFGHILETFVYQELRKQASWEEQTVGFYHFRDKDRVEVDIVLESEGHVTGVEVKAASTITNEDFKGLRKLKDALDKKFIAGVVLYDGESVVRFGEGLYAVPLSHLWENTG